MNTYNVLSVVGWLKWMKFPLLVRMVLNKYELREFPLRHSGNKIWLVSMRMPVRSLASLSGLGIQCCYELWHSSQTQLRFWVVVVVVEASSSSSNSTPSLGTSMCRRHSPKKQKIYIHTYRERDMNHISVCIYIYHIYLSLWKKQKIYIHIEIYESYIRMYLYISYISISMNRRLIIFNKSPQPSPKRRDSILPSVRRLPSFHSLYKLLLSGPRECRC